MCLKTKHNSYWFIYSTYLTLIYWFLYCYFTIFYGSLYWQSWLCIIKRYPDLEVDPFERSGLSLFSEVDRATKLIGGIK